MLSPLGPTIFIGNPEICEREQVKVSSYRQKIRTHWANRHFLLHWPATSFREGNGTPLQYSCLENPWTEEPGRLQSMGSLRVGHDWATSFSLFNFHFSLSCIGEGNGNPLQCSCLENPKDGGTWWAAVYGVAQSQTRLKRLSSSSSSYLIAVLPMERI